MFPHELSSEFSRRSLLRGSVGAAVALGISGSLAACGSGDSQSSKKIGESFDDIKKLAQKEGHLNLIAYPKTWANYGGHFKAFKKKYGIDITVANPDGSSAEELAAVEKLKGQGKEPDAVDIGYTFTESAIKKDLLAKYKPRSFDDVPADLKDPDGYWVAAYYGVMALTVNSKLVPVPRTIKDLLRPEYHGKVALQGDPRTGAADLAAVVAAAIAHGGSIDDLDPGIKFFAKLKENGNLVNISSSLSGLTTGRAAVVFEWNYQAVGNKAQLEKSGVKVDMVIPEDAVYGEYYAQPCTVDSPHPNAGRLWVDWLSSDEGAEQYALGGAVPARFVQLTKEKKLSKKALSMLPDAKAISKLTLPTAAQGKKAAKVIVERWGPEVANK